MRIWVDDLRVPPSEEEWEWVKTSKQAIDLLETCVMHGYIPGYMSLDHDLGGEDSSRPIVLWMIENEFWPFEVKVHSMNPVGRHWLESMIDRYKL